jgi:hypothetical protein
MNQRRRAVSYRTISIEPEPTVTNWPKLLGKNQIPMTDTRSNRKREISGGEQVSHTRPT